MLMSVWNLSRNYQTDFSQYLVASFENSLYLRDTNRELDPTSKLKSSRLMKSRENKEKYIMKDTKLAMHRYLII